MTVEKLSEWLGIGKGTADIIIELADEDVELVEAGRFSMTLSPWSTGHIEYAAPSSL